LNAKTVTMNVIVAPPEGLSAGESNSQSPRSQQQTEKVTPLPMATPLPEANGIVSSQSLSSSSPSSSNDDSMSVESSSSSSEPRHHELHPTNLAAQKYPQEIKHHCHPPRPQQQQQQQDERDAVRRSGREKISTLVYIDGQPVLAKNNYQVNADTYVFDKEGCTSIKPVPANKSTTTTTPRNVVKPPTTTAPRVLTESERNRVEHNQAIQAKKDSKQAAKKAFLASKLNVMEPFLDDKVKAELQTVGLPEVDTMQEKNVLYMQPEGITADLRDYQLDSLNWMVEMHKKNIGMILGDEMGLVSVFLDENDAIIRHAF
jgi:hypothetical protein